MLGKEEKRDWVVTANLLQAECRWDVLCNNNHFFQFFLPLALNTTSNWQLCCCIWCIPDKALLTRNRLGSNSNLYKTSKACHAWTLQHLLRRHYIKDKVFKMSRQVITIENKNGTPVANFWCNLADRAQALLQPNASREWVERVWGLAGNDHQRQRISISDINMQKTIFWDCTY